MPPSQLKYQQPVISIFKESGFTLDKVVREGLSEVVAFVLNMNNKLPPWEDLRAEGPSKAKAQQGDQFES